MLVAAPGSQALIQIVPRLIDDADVAVLGPTYDEHAAAWTRCGHRVREVATLTDVGDARVVVVVNPNNPTGRIVAAGDLRRVAEGAGAARRPARRRRGVCRLRRAGRQSHTAIAAGDRRAALLRQGLRSRRRAFGIRGGACRHCASDTRSARALGRVGTGALNRRRRRSPIRNGWSRSARALDARLSASRRAARGIRSDARRRHASVPSRLASARARHRRCARPRRHSRAPFRDASAVAALRNCRIQTRRGIGSNCRCATACRAVSRSGQSRMRTKESS